ncbi:MAG: hypothetical protein KDB11_33190 [Planctomycetales bacterium]|nr:hypothetical protein [Planctomycetales bacterium]
MKPQESVDWTAVRSAARGCLEATWSLVCFAENSLHDDYDVDGATCYLAAIDRAIITFKQSSQILRQDRLDSLALASVGEGPRPEFAYRNISGATAHEVSRKLLQQSLVYMEACLFCDLQLGWDELHSMSPNELWATLPRFGQMGSLQDVLRIEEIQEIRAWIDREWAAVSRLASAKQHDQAKLVSAGDCPEQNIARQPPTPDNVFRLDNDTWTIRFQGGDFQTGIKNSMPARDICFLLANAGKIKSIYDLPDNRELKPQTGSTPVATNEDYKLLTEQIQTCLNVLENDQDPETQDEVKKTLAALRKQQNENFDKNGEPRQLAGDTANVVRNTQVRVRRFYNDNNKRMPELVAHLRLSLDIYEQCLYKPDKMNWDCGEML